VRGRERARGRQRGGEGGRERLEAGRPAVFAVGGAAEVAVVVSVGRPPGGPAVSAGGEGDVVGGGEVAVNRLEGA